MTTTTSTTYYRYYGWWKNQGRVFGTVRAIKSHAAVVQYRTYSYLVQLATTAVPLSLYILVHNYHCSKTQGGAGRERGDTHRLIMYLVCQLLK